MSIKTLNQYKGSYASAESQNVVATTIVEAANILSATTEPIVLTMVQSGIKVSTPDPDLTFTTVIDNETAKEAGCAAYPAGATVANGAKVIFTAVPSSAYDFTAWEVGGVQVSTDAQAEIEITSTSTVPVNVPVTAKFTLRA